MRKERMEEEENTGKMKVDSFGIAVPETIIAIHTVITHPILLLPH